MTSPAPQSLPTPTRAESDAVELHRTLSEAVRRIAAHNKLPDGQHTMRRIAYKDLLEVLDRTGRTTLKEARG